MSTIHALPLELLERILDYAITVPPDLTTRLVYRGFRDAAWKAMADCVSDNTIFDMRGVESMTALKNVSKHEKLAKRVSGLRLGSFYVPKSFPGRRAKQTAETNGHVMEEVEYLSPLAMERLNELRQQSEAWAEMTLELYITRDSSDNIATNKEDGVINSLIDSFQSFTNISRFALLPEYPLSEPIDSSTGRIPKRYSVISDEIRNTRLSGFLDYSQPVTERNHFETMTTTDRLVHAILATKKSPRKLDLPIAKFRFCRFDMTSNGSNLMPLIQKVESLVLRQSYPCSNSLRLPKLCIISSTMPFLRRLTLNLGIDSLYSSSSDQVIPLPEITHLTLRTSIIGRRQHLKLISNPEQSLGVCRLIICLRSTLRHLRLVNILYGPWEILLAHCQSISLSALVLELEEDLVGEVANCVWDSCIPKRLELYAAASKVELNEPYRLKCEKMWENKEHLD